MKYKIAFDFITIYNFENKSLLILINNVFFVKQNSAEKNNYLIGHNNII